MARVSELFVRAIKNAGVDHVFGIPSIHNIGLYDALRDEPSIRHILCRNEAGATHMADGYSRAGRGVGVVISSTGPGACYMTPALVEAWWSSSPVLALTTNIAGDKIGKGTGTLHELEDQDRIFKNLTKQRFCLRVADDVLTMVPRAIQTALAGRSGPVYCEVPTDLWDREVSGREVGDQPAESPSGPESWSRDLEQAARLLSEADRPVIVVGTGAMRAGIGEEIRSLAEALRAPVFTNAEGKGLIPEDHELAFGNAARSGTVRETLRSATVGLAIGTRLRAADYQRRGVSLPRLIHVDWDPAWMDRNYPTEMRISGNLQDLARRLSRLVKSQPLGKEKSGWPIAALRDKMRAERAGAAEECPEIEYLDTLRRVIPPDGTLVVDNTMLGYWSEYFYPSSDPAAW